MRPNWRRTLPWAALAALAPLAAGAAPHLHDEVDGQGEHCVPCHAEDAPFNASGLQPTPEPAVRAALLPVAGPRIHGTTPTGGGGYRVDNGVAVVPVGALGP